jgi:putative ABC transport system permease protein
VTRRLDTILRNIRVSVRSLRHAPTLSLAVIITLALGIGANSAVFSVIDAVLLRPLPYPASDQLVEITHHNLRNPATFPAAPVRVEDWNRMSSVFQAIAGYYTDDASETSGELPEKLRRAFVSPRFLDLLQIAPQIGRNFSPEEMHTGGPNVTLISDRLWRRRFGADPQVIGKQLRIGQTSPTVIGVMPATFQFPQADIDLWATVPPDAPVAASRGNTWYTVLGRLKPGVTLSQASSDLQNVQSQLGEQFPQTDAQLIIGIQPLKEETVGGIRRSLWIVFGSVSLLLLIACANIAALLLSRAIQRKHEISVRFSLGASRAAIALQVLTETGILALCGAGLGLLLAAEAPNVFRAIAGNLPRMEEVHIDWRIALYSLACSIIVTLVSGLIPALRSTRRENSRLAPGVRAEVSQRHPMQWVLVAVQVALSVTLLVGAGLLLRSFQALNQVNPGFESTHVLTFHVSGSYAETIDYPGLIRRIERDLDFLQSLPGAKGSATALELPGVSSPPRDNEVSVTGQGLAPDYKVHTDSRIVSRTYFETLQIPLTAGELCTVRPSVPGAQDRPDAMVNETFAKLYFPHGFVDGQSVQGSLVKGVVGDARERGLSQGVRPTVYYCLTSASPSPYFLLRTQADPSTMIQTVRRKMKELEPGRAVFDLSPLSEKIGESYAENRLRTLLLAVFAATAVSLASVGLYSTLSYLVIVRRREIGLRLALGSERTRIVNLFFLKGLGVTAGACSAGLLLALGLTRLLSGMLFGVSASDPLTLALVIATVLLVGSLASLAPAFRAARLDPMQVLREE